MPNCRMAEARLINLLRTPCGIIRVTALWILCRYRHKVHWSGASSRLDRDMKGRFGDESYAMEELVAELGAAFLCADLAITPQTRPDHAQYIASWLKVLKSDKKAVFAAAAKAGQAAKWLLGQSDSSSGP